ncbi:uncharacterized protein EV154DRAFT_488634 [Mucor mucedo]|uniref:uncharacterized protein n=1 Tax=Mucor mucedo TaxID=29922 RepID=UPI00221F9961|nr:uncharacterized protein EV154DRAFT_488634 [Mucor mucedo]KAI7865998.1 hypothetical protein EV154DRAFT_488634 [Mucor mucedo]
MELIDIPVFLNNVPRTAPAPAIANSSAPALNSTSPSRMTVSLPIDPLKLQGMHGLPNIAVWVQDYRMLSTANLLLHDYLLEEVTLYDDVASIVHKDIAFSVKVRYHYEHLADVEKKKKYCDIVRLPATELAKRYQFRDQELIAKGGHEQVLLDLNHYTTRKKTFLRSIGNHKETFGCLVLLLYSNFCTLHKKMKKKNGISDIADIVTIVRLMKMSYVNAYPVKISENSQMIFRFYGTPFLLIISVRPRSSVDASPPQTVYLAWLNTHVA